MNTTITMSFIKLKKVVFKYQLQKLCYLWIIRVNFFTISSQSNFVVIHEMQLLLVMECFHLFVVH